MPTPNLFIDDLHVKNAYYSRAGGNPVRDSAFGLEFKVRVHPKLKALARHWIPAFAGMTAKCRQPTYHCSTNTGTAADANASPCMTSTVKASRGERPNHRNAKNTITGI